MRLLVLHAAENSGQKSITKAMVLDAKKMEMDCFWLKHNITLQQLLPYEVVLFDSVSAYINTVAISTVLSEFVITYGRGIVVCMFSNAADGAQNISYHLFAALHPLTYATCDYPQMQNMGMRHVPEHCLLNCVHTLHVENASRVVAKISNGATLVASWEDGTPMVSYKRQEKHGMVVSLNMIATFASTDRTPDMHPNKKCSIQINC